MGTFVASNEDLVSNADKFYFGNATVKGLREQLREYKLSSRGLKYELYRRLVDNGIRLYTDDRTDDIDDEDDDDGYPDDNDGVIFEEEDGVIDNSEQEYLEDDSSTTDSSSSEPEDDDEEDDSEEDEDDQDDPGQDDQEPDNSEQDDQSQDDQDQVDQDQDDQEPNDQEPDDQDQDGQEPDDQDQDDQERDNRGDSGKKRPRDDDDDDSGDGDDDNNAPAPRRRRIGPALPPELQAVIIENLNAPGVWNLIATAPEEYLRGGLNALILEARYQYRLDYPPPCAAPVMPGGFKKTVPGPWPNPGPDRPLPLLIWVARRVILDANFRTTNRRRIMRVIDAYLTVYGMADPAPLPFGAAPNPVEDLLYYFRDRADLLPNLTPLMHAARNQIPTAVQLLLMRGADVNQAINGVTALELAAAAGFNTVQPMYYNTMQTAYALIGAGADVTVLGTNSRTQASVALGGLLPDDPLPEPGQEVPEDFPRIDNSSGLSTRRFIADELSDHLDRMVLTLFVIMYRYMEYPRYV